LFLIHRNADSCHAFVCMRIQPILSTALLALVMPVCLSAEEAKPNKPESPPSEKKEDKADEKKDAKKPEDDKPVVTEGK
jgi:hypothetical protein